MRDDEGRIRMTYREVWMDVFRDGTKGVHPWPTAVTTVIYAIVWLWTGEAALGWLTLAFAALTLLHYLILPLIVWRATERYAYTKREIARIVREIHAIEESRREAERRRAELERRRQRDDGLTDWERHKRSHP